MRFLPPDLLLEICKHLDVASIESLSRCLKTSIFYKDWSLWSHLAKRDYGFPPEYFRSSGKPKHRYLTVARLMTDYDGFYKGIKEGRIDMLEPLIAKHGVHHRINDLIIRAALKDRDDIVMKLLTDENVLTSRHIDHNYLLQSMVKHGYYKYVDLLLKYGRADPSDRFDYCISEAAYAGYHQIVRRLLEDPRVNPSLYDNRALSGAILYNRNRVVEILLSDPRVNPGADNNKLLIQCLYNKSEKIINMLLSHPLVDPSKPNNMLLNNAYTDKDMRLVEALIKHPLLNVSYHNNAFIKRVISHGDTDVIKILRPRLDREGKRLADDYMKNLEIKFI